MRKALVLIVALAAALPAIAQNTDIESLSGLQFNFGNPGARSLGMGGAFLALADDASAAEANPAGLTILRKPEVSIEVRNYQEQQLLTTSGTFPDFKRTAFSHYSNRVEPTFASFVYPFKKFTIGAYYHEPLKNQGAGAVVPTRNQFTGAVETELPDFWMLVGGNGPIPKADCLKVPDKCVGFVVDPFLTALDVQERTFGAAVAYKFGKLSVGATARYQKFRENAFTFRLSATTFEPLAFVVQATAKADGTDLSAGDKNDSTFSGGLKFEATDKISFGAVYKKGPKFISPTFVAKASNNFDFVKLADTTFHVPDVYGAGISVRPLPVLTVNFDAVHVTYKNLIDDFHSNIAVVQTLKDPYKIDDVTELHLGGEYFFSTKIPFAIRAGAWRDPAHAMQYNASFHQSDVL